MTTAVPATPPVVRQLVRFAVVGVANTVTCLAILWSLRDAAGWPVWLASGLGYAVGIMQSYWLNRSWTFAGGAATPVGPQLLRFILVNILVGGVFSAVTSLLAERLGVRVASLAALVPATVLSFALARRFVFAAPARARR